MVGDCLLLQLVKISLKCLSSFEGVSCSSLFPKKALKNYYCLSFCRRKPSGCEPFEARIPSLCLSCHAWLWCNKNNYWDGIIWALHLTVTVCCLLEKVGKPDRLISVSSSAHCLSGWKECNSSARQNSFLCILMECCRWQLPLSIYKGQTSFSAVDIRTLLTCNYPSLLFFSIFFCCICCACSDTNRLTGTFAVFHYVFFYPCKAKNLWGIFRSCKWYKPN